MRPHHASDRVGLPVVARCRMAMARLDVAPVEVAALAVLTTGALVALGLLWLLARPEPAPAPAVEFADAGAPAEQGSAENAAPAGEVTVHVAGRVAAPGVYQLPATSRVTDALALAGGPLEDAALESINLARPLTDGEQLLVPGPGVAAPAPDGATLSGGGAQRPDGTLDLNLATVEDLDELPGVGPVLAERIVTHRTEIGRFRAVDELRDVSGIGEKRFQELAPRVSV